MAGYEACGGTGRPAVERRKFTNQSGSPKFFRNQGKIYGRCGSCAKSLMLPDGTNAPRHKSA